MLQPIARLRSARAAHRRLRDRSDALPFGPDRERDFGVARRRRVTGVYASVGDRTGVLARVGRGARRRRQAQHFTARRWGTLELSIFGHIFFGPVDVWATLVA